MMPSRLSAALQFFSAVIGARLGALYAPNHMQSYTAGQEISCHFRSFVLTSSAIAQNCKNGAFCGRPAEGSPSGALQVLRLQSMPSTSAQTLSFTHPEHRTIPRVCRCKAIGKFGGQECCSCGITSASSSFKGIPTENY